MEFGDLREVDEEVDLTPYRPPINWQVNEWLWDSSVLVQLALGIHTGVLVIVTAIVVESEAPAGFEPFQGVSVSSAGLLIVTLLGLVLLWMGLVTKRSFWPWHQKFWIVLLDAILVGSSAAMSNGFGLF